MVRAKGGGGSTAARAGRKAPGARPGTGLDEPEDWRGRTLERVRALVRRADPEVVEETKWRKPSRPGGIPVWSREGILFTGETYRDKVKLTFARGAALDDPSGLFNSGLEGRVRRAIDLRAGDRLDEEAFAALVRAAVALNRSRAGGGR